MTEILYPDRPKSDSGCGSIDVTQALSEVIYWDGILEGSAPRESLQIIFHLHDQGLVALGIGSGQDKEAFRNSEQVLRGVQSLNDKDNGEFLDRAREIRKKDSH